MKRLDEILAFNKSFVEGEGYSAYETTKFPNKKMIIFSCMDTRLTGLLPAAMNLKNGDAKVIKNAGAMLTHPFGSVMRSIIVAIYELGAEEIYVVGHKGCGMSGVDYQHITQQMLEAGIEEGTIDTIKNAGIDLENWLKGFDSVEDSVRDTVDKINRHPLVPGHVIVHGLIMDPHTGALELVVEDTKTQLTN